MTASQTQMAQTQLARILIDNLPMHAAQGLLEAVAEAHDVPTNRLCLSKAMRDRSRHKRTMELVWSSAGGS